MFATDKCISSTGVSVQFSLASKLFPHKRSRSATAHGTLRPSSTAFAYVRIWLVENGSQLRSQLQGHQSPEEVGSWSLSTIQCSLPNISQILKHIRLFEFVAVWISDVLSELFGISASSASKRTTATKRAIDPACCELWSPYSPLC